ncbi:MAG TPA: SOS response-associated peptidase [Dehalococcoidales bacterium]|nr:SOS response-associated peptidase [Dehalococcoidales bacterium]
MCYYSSISVGFKILETRFGVRFVQTEAFQPVYSVSAFTFPLMPVITNEHPDQIDLLHWGLIPYWTRDNVTALKLKERGLNARCETVCERPMFRHCMRAKRCLVLADGFFEWRHFNNKRYPYYIRLKNHEPFAFAGIWDQWADKESGEVVKTFSIITTEANSLLAEIHNTKKRMPVILPKDIEKTWLNNSLTLEDTTAMLKPYPADKMEAYTVDRSIARLGLNTTVSSILSEKKYPDLPTLVGA